MEIKDIGVLRSGYSDGLEDILMAFDIATATDGNDREGTGGDAQLLAQAALLIIGGRIIFGGIIPVIDLDGGVMEISELVLIDGIANRLLNLMEQILTAIAEEHMVRIGDDPGREHIMVSKDRTDPCPPCTISHGALHIRAMYMDHSNMMRADEMDDMVPIYHLAQQ